MMRRRDVLQLVVPVATLGLLACKGSTKTCSGPGPKDLDAETASLREKLGYISVAKVADERCDRCSYYVAAAGCGTCKVVSGPIDPAGTCDLYRR